MEKREINGKWVYEFESHNTALEAWVELKANHHELNLITIDHHTDTNSAFGKSSFVRDYARGDQAKETERINERIAEIDWRKKHQIQKAVAELHNDEQIDAAIDSESLALLFASITVMGTLLRLRKKIPPKNSADFSTSIVISCPFPSNSLMSNHYPIVWALLPILELLRSPIGFLRIRYLRFVLSAAKNEVMEMIAIEMIAVGC